MRHRFSPGSGFFGVGAAVLLVWSTAASAQLGGLPYVDPRVLALEIKCNKLQDIINKLEGAVSDLLTRLTCVSRQEGEINGVSGPHLVVTGCNVHIRSGSGATHDTTNLGNLIIGYNEPRDTDTSNRTGAHNLVIGPEHQFTSSGGLLAGFRNTVSGQSSTVSGGERNTASGNAASVSGGWNNTASAFFASNSFRFGGTASVSGGELNVASGGSSSVSGGQQNVADGGATSVSGGRVNTASGFVTSVSGGFANTASGEGASVSGGQSNTASGGDMFVPTSGGSVSGGRLNTASGTSSSVSGGSSRAATGPDDWAAGSLSEDN